MAKKLLLNFIIEQIKNSPKAREALAAKAKDFGLNINPENWKELLAFLKQFAPQLFEFLLKIV